MEKVKKKEMTKQAQKVTDKIENNHATIDTFPTNSIAENVDDKDGGTDHQRSSSELCKAGKNFSSNSQEPNSSPKKGRKKKKKQGNNESEETGKYHDSISRPNFIYVGSERETFEPVVDVSSASFTPRPTSFK
eukprot:11835757-Ditylum_brightwellii.AAC.1